VEECQAETARRNAEVEAKLKEEKRKQARAAAIARENRRIAEAQESAQRNQARTARMKASRIAACEELRAQGKKEFFERFAGKYEKLYRECMAKVEEDYFNP
jgi:hypothetical protein